MALMTYNEYLIKKLLAGLDGTLHGQNKEIRAYYYMLPRHSGYRTYVSKHLSHAAGIPEARFRDCIEYGKMKLRLPEAEVICRELGIALPSCYLENESVTNQ